MQQRDRPYEIGLANDDTDLTDDQIKELFKSFVDTFRIGVEYVYREELAQNKNLLRIVVEHMSTFDARLFEGTMSRPLHYLELFQAAINDPGKKERHLEIVSNSTVTPIRKLDASHINKISTVRGIVLSVSPAAPKPILLYAFCRTCLHSRFIKDILPKKCEACGGVETFISSPEKSILQDTQYIKIQETFEDLPPGEIPRHLQVRIADGLVDTVQPGSSVTITGVYTVCSRLGTPFLRATGTSGSSTVAVAPRVHAPLSRETVIRSISPEVFGHDDVKLALACALFGGVQRTFEDGVRVRGDVNVLLLGDPGIAKSQMLKFLSGVSPRGVYTSGKGASAAGLTASVCRDKTGAFHLEGGALVLADGGLCCIDEFDKMQEKDRVAIHEAMEQQTISISKAGIVTSLPSQCAVVAAANPVFGRYDESRGPAENIDFGVTILSRFDLIFVLRDTMQRDKKVAEHVIKRLAGGQTGGVSTEELRAYVTYARTIQPAMEEEASQRLQAFYVQTRRRAGGAGVPITVRQLEAVARVSEALARMCLETVVTASHVEEAIRLFTESTVKAVSMGHCVEGMPRAEWARAHAAVEAALRSSLPVGVARPYKALLRELCRNHSEGVVTRCIDGMIRKERLCVANGGKTIIRMP
ncbi:DNA replication licensing factor MCM5 [Nematocida major]|uniref:DNA replication licensing factor MCM5 n=1 Tax=Nematocida major TaxID=1912982 RepID=UPI0020073C9B|nr:DNA replication licensing factor MCM5 [Nematocida major]KAH9385733.1 DNA replication licensing factor MCM5 [Nematocida major]